MKRFAASVVMLFAIGFSVFLEAAPLNAPSGLAEGSTFRFIVVTSAVTAATSNNIIYYNTFVQQNANGATFGGSIINWKAVVSTSAVNARDNVGGVETNVPIYLSDGRLFARSLLTTGNGLWRSGFLAENGGILTINGLDPISNPPNTLLTWTGSNSDGTRSNNYPLGAAFVLAGLSLQTNSTWITLSDFSAGGAQPIYAISELLTVPVSSSSSGSGGATITIITSGATVGLSSLGASPVLAGGTLVLLPSDSSSAAFSVSSASTIQNPSSGTATLSGVFSGAGSLTFTGAGTTVMSGANTYSGGTTVSGGTLSLAGGSPTGTGDVYVASAGSLMGTGTIAGNLTVAGVLKPGNSPGYLAASSNLVMNSGSTYQQDIAGLTQASRATPVGASGYYSLLTVDNQFTINSGATLVPRLSNLFTSTEPGYGSSIYVPALGDMFRMVVAGGGITGRFTTLTQPAELTSGTQFVAFYNVNNSHSIDLAVTPISYATTLASSNTNAKQVASVLDQLLGVNSQGTATARQDALLYAAAGQTASSLPSFAQALAGGIHAASVATLPQTTQRVQQSVLARLSDYPVALGQSNPALNQAVLTGGLSGTNPSGLPTASMSTNPAVNPNQANVTSAAVADGTVWGEIAYQRGERTSNHGTNGFNNNLYQVVLGADAYTNSELGLKLGGGFALSNTTVTATGGNSTVQQGSVFAYGKRSILQDYVLDGMVSVGLSATNLSRNDPTGYTGSFSSKAVMGNDALVSVGLSRPFETSDVRITPYVRLTYQYVGQAAYDEGSSAAALNVGRMNTNGVRAVIGVGAGSLNKDPLKQGYTYRANLAIGADSQGLLNPSLNTTLGGYSSSVTVPTAGTGFVQAGLYGTIKVADSAYAYAGVSAEARTGQTLYGGSVGLRMAF
jgi:autotransporter-associated beta strand protein